MINIVEMNIQWKYIYSDQAGAMSVVNERRINQGSL